MKHANADSREKEFYSGGFLYHPTSQEILLHLRDSKTNNNPNVWAFFGGLSQKNENPEQTFRREVLEELHITLDTVDYIQDYVNPDFATHRYVYVASVNQKPLFQLHEGKSAEWFTPKHALTLPLSKRTREDLVYWRNQLLQK